MKQSTLYVLGLVVLVSSCVPSQKYSFMKEDYDRVIERHEKTLEENRVLKEKLNELQLNNRKLEGKTVVAEKNTKKLEEARLQLLDEIERLKLESGARPDSSNLNTEEVKRLLKKVKDANIALVERENKLEVSENIRLAEQKRLKELQEALKRKDDAVNDLKAKVSKALLGFRKQGLSVDIKNGKVYVSVQEKLLFKSGSWKVGEKGKKALLNLSNVLAKNKDINIMVEGHTDDIPYKRNSMIYDNWDLSVKRSTSIIRILIKNKGINPHRLIAAGRSKYCPVSNKKTQYSRARNRRTEIILTPKLDEVFKILEN